MKTHKEPTTNFLRVRCDKCKNEQNIFSAVSNKVNCLVCGELIVEPCGGRSNVRAKILEILP